MSSVIAMSSKPTCRAMEGGRQQICLARNVIVLRLKPLYPLNAAAFVCALRSALMQRRRLEGSASYKPD